jgi:hypothetical protein
MPEESDKVGSVFQQRYEQIVAELRDVAAQQSRGRLTIGDRATERADAPRRRVRRRGADVDGRAVVEAAGG